MKGVVIVTRMKIGGICAKYALLWWRKKLDREFAQFVIFQNYLTIPFDDGGGDVGVVSYCEGGYDGADDQ